MIPGQVSAYRSRLDRIVVSLLVKVPSDGTKAELRTDVDSGLGRGWTIVRLFETDLAKPELMRWYRVTGELEQAGLTEVQAAWEAAHRLRQLGDYEIEPQIPKTTYAPTRDAMRSGGAPRTHLPGSASKTWALAKSGVLDAWKLDPPPGGRVRGAGVVIGHPDTGYTRHREVYPTALDLELDRDFLDADDDAQDPMRIGAKGHGTSTGSVIASRSSFEMSGAASAATLRPIRAITDVVVPIGGGHVAAAIDYARRTGADVISMSLGGLFLGGVRDAVNAAVEDGCIVLAAAGNVWPMVAEPANYPSCIGVAGVNANDARWADSAAGRQVAISAPAESVWTAVWIGDTQKVERRDGTSYAVAIVAGVAALWLAFNGPGKMRAKYGSLTSAAFRTVLRESARRPPNWDSSNMGAGIVNAVALLRRPLPDSNALRVAPVARVRAVPSGRDVLRQVTAPAVYRRLTSAVEAPVPTQGGPRRRAGEQAMDRELLYRELVYIGTEQPGALESIGRARARGRAQRVQAEVAERAFASPTLARQFSNTGTP